MLAVTLVMMVIGTVWSINALPPPVIAEPDDTPNHYQPTQAKPAPMPKMIKASASRSGRAGR